jgi:hypothetical protein
MGLRSEPEKETGRKNPAGLAVRICAHKTMVKTERKTIQKDGRELQLVAILLSIQPGDNVESQFGLMVDTLYQWYKKHGNACREFTIRFSGSTENHEALMTYLLSIIQQEEPLRPLFAQLGQVNVIFVSPNGIVMKESKLMIGQPEGTKPPFTKVDRSNAT